MKGNLVANAGFETGDFSNWSLSGNLQGGFDGNFYGVGTDENLDTCTICIPVQSGTYAAYFGVQTTPLDLSQTLTVDPLTSYTISFWLYQDALTDSNPTPPYSSIFTAAFNGTTLLTLDDPPQSTAYQEYTFTLTTAASGNSGLLEFTFQNDSDYFYFDSVDVESTIPEPASILLTGASLAGVALAVWRKHHVAAPGQPLRLRFSNPEGNSCV